MYYYLVTITRTESYSEYRKAVKHFLNSYKSRIIDFFRIRRTLTSYYAHGILYVTNIIIANGNVTFTSVTLDGLKPTSTELYVIFKLISVKEVIG